MAITTPFFHATTSLNPTISIPVAEVEGCSKLEMAAIAGNPAVHAIVFAMRPGSSTAKQQFNYATAAARDTDFADFQTQLSTSL